MQLNNNFNKTEEYFNVAGGIPVVAIVSGSIRSLAGAIQAFAGMFFGILGLLGMLTYPKNDRWEAIAKNSFEQLTHGAMNFLRGTGEYLVGLTIIGSLALFLFQSTSTNKFQPFYKYHTDPANKQQDVNLA